MSKPVTIMIKQRNMQHICCSFTLLLYIYPKEKNRTRNPSKNFKMCTGQPHVAKLRNSHVDLHGYKTLNSKPTMTVYRRDSRLTQQATWCLNFFAVYCLQPAGVSTNHKMQLTAQCDIRGDKNIITNFNIYPVKAADNNIKLQRKFHVRTTQTMQPTSSKVPGRPYVSNKSLRPDEDHDSKRQISMYCLGSEWNFSYSLFLILCHYITLKRSQIVI